MSVKSSREAFQIKFHYVNCLRFIFVLFFCSLSTVNAEGDPGISEQAVVTGWYVGPMYGVTEIRGKNVLSAGIEAALKIKQQYYIGLLFGGLSDQVENTDRNMNYSGLIAGLIIRPKNRLHYSVDLSIGGGTLPIVGQQDPDPDTYTFIRPRFNINFTLNQISQIKLSISYRTVTDITYSALSEDDLSGAEVTLGFMFGRF